MRSVVVGIFVDNKYFNKIRELIIVFDKRKLKNTGTHSSNEIRSKTNYDHNLFHFHQDHYVLSKPHQGDMYMVEAVECQQRTRSLG